MKKSILLGYAFLLTISLRSQDTDIGIIGGASVYSGDLSPQEFGIYLDDIGIAGGVFTRVRFSRFLGFRAGLTTAGLSGDERRGGVNRVRGLNFQSRIYELSMMGEWNIFNFGYYRAKTVFAPYLTFGVAAFYSDPKMFFRGNWVRLRSLGTEGQGIPGYADKYGPVQLSLPMGIGVHFVIKDKWTLGFEVIGRRVNTDYLDDVTSRGVKYGDVLENNGVLAAQISNPLLSPTPENGGVTYERGGKYNDWYYISGITVSYRIRNEGTSKSRYLEKSACPRFY